MPGIFSFSNEAVSSFGNPHSLALEDNGLAPPRPGYPDERTHTSTRAPEAHVSGDSNPFTNQARLTDAVIAASKLLNNVKSNSSVMGDDLDMQEVRKTDELVRCMSNAALAKPDAFGPARLIRLGLFVDEYSQFRRAVAMKQMLDDLVKQRALEFRERACVWSNEIINMGQPRLGSVIGRIPWKKIAIFGGLAVALGLGVNYYMTWKRAEATP
jgi:hypothetical protein